LGAVAIADPIGLDAAPGGPETAAPPAADLAFTRLDDAAMKLLLRGWLGTDKIPRAMRGIFRVLMVRVTEAAGSAESAESGFRAAKAEWAWSFSFPG
jgi:hypothetical protein